MLDPHKLNTYDSERPTHLTFVIDNESMVDLLKPAFAEPVGPEPDRIFAVMAVETDLRMFVQQGAFTIHSMRTPLDSWRNNREYLTPIVIRAAHIDSFAEDLFRCGVREGDVFPDVDHLAEGRARYEM
jgi:hypothetical protein